MITPDADADAWLLLVLQQPPATASFAVIVEPIHTLVGAVIVPASGSGLIVITFEVVAVPQALEKVYKTESLPAVTPETIPVAEIVACGLLTLQLPPETASDRATYEPAHTPDGPVIIPAYVPESIVIVAVAVAVPQALLTEYRIESRPAVIAETTPEPDTEAWELLALQVPPVAASLRDTDEPMHALVGPVIVPAEGAGLIVIKMPVEAEQKEPVIV